MTAGPVHAAGCCPARAGVSRPGTAVAAQASAKAARSPGPPDDGRGGEGDEVFPEPVGIERFQHGGRVLRRVALVVIGEDLAGVVRHGSDLGLGQHLDALRLGQRPGQGRDVHRTAHGLRRCRQRILGARMPLLPVRAFPLQQIRRDPGRVGRCRLTVPVRVDGGQGGHVHGEHLPEPRLTEPGRRPRGRAGMTGAGDAHRGREMVPGHDEQLAPVDLAAQRRQHRRGGGNTVFGVQPLLQRVPPETRRPGQQQHPQRQRPGQPPDQRVHVGDQGLQMGRRPPVGVVHHHQQPRHARRHLDTSRALGSRGRLPGLPHRPPRGVVAGELCRQPGLALPAGPVHQPHRHRPGLPQPAHSAPAPSQHARRTAPARNGPAATATAERGPAPPSRRPAPPGSPPPGTPACSASPRRSRQHPGSGRRPRAPRSRPPTDQRPRRAACPARSPVDVHVTASAIHLGDAATDLRISDRLPAPPPRRLRYRLRHTRRCKP